MVNVRKHIDVNERWEQGIDHDPRSKELLKFMSEYDAKFCNLALDLSYGGDGDIGESLMYLMDEFFAAKDEEGGASDDNAS